MITSFGQYLLMAPSYINVLNVYAVRLSIFCSNILFDRLPFSLQTYTTFPGVPKETTHLLLLGPSHMVVLQLAKIK